MPFKLLPRLLVLFCLSLLILVLGLLLGSVNLPLEAIVSVLSGQGAPLHKMLILELRLPRVLAAFATGGLLAVAGALMQVLLRNPLADPYILGLSGGAAVAALLTMLAGLGVFWVSSAAFTGALLSTFLVFGLAYGSGQSSATRLLLTGVVVASGWGALISFILATSQAQQLPGMLYWLMGDLSHAPNPLIPWVVLLVVLCLLIPLGRTLNVLARGALQAAALGVSVQKVELLIFGLAALLTAIAVTLAGSIGFVGLIVPHLMRMLFGYDQRILLPASALAGGSLLVLADTLARIIIAPQQLPVGVITAMLGVPVFLLLLYRSNR
ncbi:FecCD family ABC transporter permease [Marinospirillum insulare]|uniref:Iron ABC transporter n=1 Tax=Marinospirillum insulare TaxID=217169 RepID=A0ABQ5ZZV8_9GAMM|nr:iron ABC transporter permease [Marinospirillum insulare]GLR65066.1 iron ABC transporter [Marinospirillum insulare]